MNILSLIRFTFAAEICQQDPNLHMTSVDTDSLFTNILLEQIIDICIDSLFNGNENPPNISRHDFCNLANIATVESFFMFNNKYYKQVDGVAMGSPLASALAHIFMFSLNADGFEIVLMISNLCSIDVMLMTYSHYLLFLIMPSNLRGICHLNIPT